MVLPKDSARDIKLPLISYHCKNTVRENSLWRNVSQNVKWFENLNTHKLETLQLAPEKFDNHYYKSIERVNCITELNNNSKQRKATKIKRYLDKNSTQKLLSNTKRHETPYSKEIYLNEINRAIQNTHALILELEKERSIVESLKWLQCFISKPEQYDCTIFLVWILSLLLQKKMDNNIKEKVDAMVKQSTDVQLTSYWNNHQQYNRYCRSMIKGIYILSVLRGHPANIFKFILKLFRYTKFSTETSVIIFFKIDSIMILHEQYLESPKYTCENITWNKEHKCVLTKVNLFVAFVTSSKAICSYTSEQVPSIINRARNHNTYINSCDYQEVDRTNKILQITPEIRLETDLMSMFCKINIAASKSSCTEMRKFVQPTITNLSSEVRKDDAMYTANVTEEIEIIKNKVSGYFNCMITKVISEFETAKEFVSNFGEETFEFVGFNLQIIGDSCLSYVTSESFRLNIARQLRQTLLQTFFTHSM